MRCQIYRFQGLGHRHIFWGATIQPITPHYLHLHFWHAGINRAWTFCQLNLQIAVKSTLLYVSAALFLFQPCHSSHIILHSNQNGYPSWFENLLWLMALRTKTKLLTMACKALHNLAPTHLASLFSCLSSSFCLQCHVPPVTVPSQYFLLLLNDSLLYPIFWLTPIIHQLISNVKSLLKRCFLWPSDWLKFPCNCFS